MVVEPVAAARDAFSRHAWAESAEAFAMADRSGELSGDDLEAYSQAAYFTGQPDLELELLERAFHRREADGAWRYSVAETGGAVVLAEGATLDVDAIYAGAFDLELG